MSSIRRVFLEDEMANMNTVLDVQEEVLHALQRVTEDRTDLRTRLKIKQSETDQVRRDLENAEAQVATVTEELRASEEKASLQNGELSGLLSKLQASQDDLQQQLLHTQAALQTQEQQKMSDSAVAAEATQSLQAANAALQTKIDELQSQVEAKQKELAALAENPSGFRSQSHGRRHAAPNCPTEGGKPGARVTGVPAPLCARVDEGFAVSARSRTCATATGRGQQ